MSEKNDDFLSQMKKQFDDLNYRWNIERNKLEANSQIAGAEARKQFEDKRKDLREFRKEMEAKIAEMEDAGENAWDDVMDGAQDAWKALATAFDNATSHFKK